MEKYYEFHWLDGQIFYSKGFSEEDAARKAGISSGALRAMDYVTEVKEIPLDDKEIRYFSLDGDVQILNRETLFVKKSLEHIKNNENCFEIHLGRYTLKCTAEIKPFEIVLTEKRRRKING